MCFTNLLLYPHLIGDGFEAIGIIGDQDGRSHTSRNAHELHNELVDE
jgi:hypothetical protein